MRRLPLVLAWFVLQVTIMDAVAQPDPDQAGPAPDNKQANGQDTLEDVDEALQVLDEAGVPPTQEELSRFLAAAEDSAAGRSASGLWRSLHGTFRVRTGHFQEEDWDLTGRASVTSRWLGIRARFREHRTGGREMAATAELRVGPVELRMGKLGLVQGFGLLVGAPGRSASLGADRSFGPRAGRMVNWIGSPDPRVISGAGGQLKLRNWTIRVLTGVGAGKIPGFSRSTVAAQVSGQGDGWRLTTAVLEKQTTTGGSLAMTWVQGPIDWGFETMVQQTSPTRRISGAGVMKVGWNLGRGSGVEGLWGLSDLTMSSPMASRPAVLPGWSGRGYALRGFARLATGGHLRGLIHRGVHLDRIGDRIREEKILVDLQAGQNLHPNLEVWVRFRRTDRRRWGWQERYPWQPPRQVGAESRTIMSTVLIAEVPGLRGRLLARSYGRSSETGPGRRSLLSLSVIRQAGPQWRLRGTWVTAWGNPVDLVSAVNPLTGLVLPRHWGHWRSETVLGVEWQAGPGRFQVGWSTRRPEVEYGDRMVHTVWADAAARW